MAMNTILNLHGETTRSWRKRKSTNLPSYRSPSFILVISLLTLSLLFFVFSRFSFQTTKSLFVSQTLNPQNPKCGNIRTSFEGEKFMWYAPHSGFSNQQSELKNAILMAGILNRTLVVPPVLDHHAVVLGSCPKFRVTEPNEIRASVWNHAIELMKSGRYVSMADIIDMSSLVSASLHMIDLREFATIFCGVNMDLTCVDDMNAGSSLLDSLRECGNVLSGRNGNIDECLYAVNEDCRTTVWTYENGDDGALDSFQADELLRKKKRISYVRKRRDVYKNLGPGSAADSATVLAFGSLFSAPYKGSESHVDIRKVKKSEFLPFVPEILNAGKKFALDKIKDPFVCVQLRLLDGQFKNHWKATFQGVRQKLESLNQGDAQPINIFVMTDLPRANWSRTYLGELASDAKHYKLHSLGEEDGLVLQTARHIAKKASKDQHCPHQKLPDILLDIEESVCSCASLGFVGTAGSTIAESIQLMRKSDVCSILNRTAR
ncbi:O-fucosyltransferase 30 [Linum perenne]